MKTIKEKKIEEAHRVFRFLEVIKISFKITTILLFMLKNLKIKIRILQKTRKYKNKIETGILEMKNTVREIKSSMDCRFNDRFLRAEERIANQR